MSKPKSRWWGYVRSVIRDYKSLSRRRLYLKPGERQELKAVEDALAETAQMEDGEIRRKIVTMVLIEKTHTLEGAALAASVSYGTAKNKLGGFIRCVAKHLRLPQV